MREYPNSEATVESIGNLPPLRAPHAVIAFAAFRLHRRCERRGIVERQLIDALAHAENLQKKFTGTAGTHLGNRLRAVMPRCRFQSRA